MYFRLAFCGKIWTITPTLMNQKAKSQNQILNSLIANLVSRVRLKLQGGRSHRAEMRRVWLVSNGFPASEVRYERVERASSSLGYNYCESRPSETRCNHTETLRRGQHRPRKNSGRKAKEPADYPGWSLRPLPRRVQFFAPGKGSTSRARKLGFG